MPGAEGLTRVSIEFGEKVRVPFLLITNPYDTYSHIFCLSCIIALGYLGRLNKVSFIQPIS